MNRAGARVEKTEKSASTLQTISKSFRPGTPTHHTRLPITPSSGLATNSIFFHFRKKSLICLEGKSMTPGQGNPILFRSSQQLPRLCHGPLKGAVSAQKALVGSETETRYLQG